MPDGVRKHGLLGKSGSPAQYAGLPHSKVGRRLNGEYSLPTLGFAKEQFHILASHPCPAQCTGLRAPVYAKASVYA